MKLTKKARILVLFYVMPDLIRHPETNNPTP